jgi:ubiquinone biosynthesis UbiH/UbiF/VisC/COQ6 family hydroxylase
LRLAAGLHHELIDYAQTGLVAHLNAERAHQDAAFQWFGEHGVLALLPLPDSVDGAQVSMVWSMPTERAQAMQALTAAEQKAQLATWLRQVTGARLGHLQLRSALQGFPLTLERAQMIAPQIALVGDAAHRLHPLAGQGLNLGLGDAQALASVVAASEPFRQAGDLQVLRRYQRMRAEPVLAMRLATHGLHTLFRARALPWVCVRNLGMQWVQSTALLKRGLIIGAARN